MTVSRGFVDDFRHMVLLICRDFFKLDVEGELDKGVGKQHIGRGYYFTNLKLRTSNAEHDVVKEALLNYYIELLLEPSIDDLF